MTVYPEFFAAALAAETLRRPYEELHAENQRLREALRFYANEADYRWSEGPPPKRGVIQSEDRGAVARAALEEA